MLNTALAIRSVTEVTHEQQNGAIIQAQTMIRTVELRDAEDSSDEEDIAEEETKSFRHEQVDIFKSLALKKAKEIEIAQEKKRERHAAEVKNELSIAELLKSEAYAGADDPREYQQELAERAKQENTIAVLETGSGKTLIAVMLLKWILDQELTDREAGLPKRVSFFLVPSNTLVYQQFAVLDSCLDQKIDRRCGDMNARNPLEKTAWVKRLDENMVVVCTPEILYQCLVHSLVTMNDINLLVFDEAHHAKMEHPYARIIRDFYKDRRGGGPRAVPRVFGMTASPFDAKGDLVLASRNLELLLDSKIATFPVSEQYRNKPAEINCKYARLEDSTTTALHRRLAEQFGNLSAFSRLFRTSENLCIELGGWAADKYWQHALREEERGKAESKVAKGHRATSVIDSEIQQLQQARELVRNHDFGTPNMTADHNSISSKVVALHQLLCMHYDKDYGNRTIVFVEQKATARMLKEIFELGGATHLRPGLLTGQATKSGDLNISFRQQVITMANFRNGVINCIFATSVAEEGLDVPACNLVIRFDLYKTAIEYIQSKGRARHKNSKFVDMMEEGNFRHAQAQRDARLQEARLRSWIENLDPSRKLGGNEDYQQLPDDKTPEYFEYPGTHAKLTYWSALTVLMHFASTLPTEDRNITLQPTYVMSSDTKGYYCEVIMPVGSPIRSCLGKRFPRKAIAKRSAAFSMCIELIKAKHLDGNLLSKFKKLKIEGANAHLALKGKQKKYVMQLKPKAWANGRGSVPESLYLTVIDMLAGLDRPHQPIGLLTRCPLPQLPRFPLFLDSAELSMVELSPMPRFLVSQSEVSNFTKYTLLLMDHVNSKTFEEDSAKMSYWVVPVIGGCKEQTNSRERIDWAAISKCVTAGHKKWQRGMPIEALENRFIVDPWAGNRRFFTRRVVPELQPLSDIPDDSVRFARPGANKKKSILQFSISLFGKKFDEVWESWDRTQPVVECDPMLHRQNLLAPPSPKEQTLKGRAYLCLEPMLISSLSVEVVSMFKMFPAIIHRIEDYLIALEAVDLVGIQVGPALALEAMTKDSDNSDEHTEDAPINFRPGMGNNYERLEFMGDCFLKMATSISLFVLKENYNEGEFHVARMQMICNQNLMQLALDRGLTAYVRSMAFSRRLWYPDGLELIQGKGQGRCWYQVQKHSLADKAVADVCEALIGAAFIQHNDQKTWDPSKWSEAVKAVTSAVDDDNHRMKDWNAYRSAYKAPDWQTRPSTAPQRDLAAKILREQGYAFRYPRLLRSAFSHPTMPYTWEHIPSYQRLEFLGDALLDMACITHLFYNYPTKGPQWLTEHKMAMVSNKFLGAVCVKIGFHKHMRSHDGALLPQIRNYVEEVTLAESLARASAKQDPATADRELDYWTAVRDPPKCLPDLVEAYIGALFVDSGFDYARVQRFFDAHILPFFRDMSVYDSFARDHPTTRLHHTLAEVYGCEAYRLLCERLDPDTVGAKPKMMAGVMVHRALVAAEVAESGRYARERASRAAVEELRGLSVGEFRLRFGCDCKVKDGEGVASFADCMDAETLDGGVALGGEDHGAL